MMIQLLKDAYNELTHKIKQIEKYLENTPEGYLKVRERNRIYSYFQVTEKDGKINVHYLKLKDKDDIRIINLLAHKHYYKKLLPIIKKEHSIIKKFLEQYKPEEKYEVFDNMVPGRKAIVHPVFRRKNELIHEFVEKWKTEEWDKYVKYPERLIYETARGELVRSKSEVIIANQLYINQDLCIYRYESAVVINGITCHPDFTILKVSTGEVFYWEHFGMMDDEDYLNDALRKINHYIHAGIYPGKQLICTFESKNQPLDIRTVKELILEYFSN